MISVCWLLLIVPVSVIFGLFLGALMSVNKKGE